MNAITSEPDPLEIDPRICKSCGLTIDRHEMVDAGEGPVFFCVDLEREIYLAACAMIRDWELDDPRDRWRHTGEPRPAPIADSPGGQLEPSRTAQSTVDAFWFVVGLQDPERFKAWLADRPKDTPFLLQILESK